MAQFANYSNTCWNAEVLGNLVFTSFVVNKWNVTEFSLWDNWFLTSLELSRNDTDENNKENVFFLSPIFIIDDRYDSSDHPPRHRSHGSSMVDDDFDPGCTRTLFVGNIEKTTTFSDLKEAFERYGEIVVSNKDTFDEWEMAQLLVMLNQGVNSVDRTCCAFKEVSVAWIH